MTEMEREVLLPITGEEFDRIADSVFATSGLPDQPSYRHAIGSYIMHLGPAEDRVQISDIAKAIRKAIANQVAYNKMKQLEQEEAAKSAQGTGTDEPVVQNT